MIELNSIIFTLNHHVHLKYSSEFDCCILCYTDQGSYDINIFSQEVVFVVPG